MKRSMLATCAMCLALAACTVGPDYERPRLAPPAAYAYDDGTQTATTQADLASWWQQFGDPVLDRLVDQALADNLDLQIAASRIAEARHRLAGVQASAMPQVGLTGSANRTRVSKNGGLSSLAGALGGGSSGSGGGGGGSGIGLPGDSFTTFSTGFDASWELDLFGGKRRAGEAASDDLAASEWSQRDTQVQLTAEVARAYFTLRELQAQQAIASKLIEVRSAAVDVVRTQVAHGLAPGSALTGPTTLLEQARAQQAQLQGAEAAQRTALAVLLGTTVQQLPDDLTAPGESAVTVPLAIPAGLPSELLQRRPDIRVAERDLAAATARIGVARADRFPKISLTGVVELISTGLGNLLSSNSLQTLAQGQASAPLIDFGRGAANEGIAREQAQQASLAYRQAVLGAFADVEQALARLSAERAQSASAQAQLQQALQAQAAAEARFGNGLTDYTPLAEAQEGVLEARLSLLESNLALRQAEIATFKALGGGWS